MAKIKMLSDYWNVPGYPEKGDILEVDEYVIGEDDDPYFVCQWNGRSLEIDPYEAEEIKPNSEQDH